MNLVTDPWLPVSDSKNVLRYISLNQLFEQPDEWLDLVLRPHERISIMRLLICIVQAALHGPADMDEWNEVLDKIPEASLKYLKKWQGSFNLYDEERPFLQIKELQQIDKEPVPVTKLDFSLATRSNSTLFDHSAISAKGDELIRTIEESRLILSMITFNNFSLGGLYSQVIWKDKKTSKYGVTDSPCSSQSMLHCFIRKATIIASLHANILTREQIKDRYNSNIGIPIWDCFPTSPTDEKAKYNATETYLGRLVPLSRWIKILPDKKTMLMGEGFVYPVYPKYTEATSVVITLNVNNNEEQRILGCKTITPWRELCSLTTKRVVNGEFGGPAAIENQPKTESYDFHILAIKRDKASILDTVESILYVPEDFSDSIERRASYTDGVKRAEITAGRLSKSIQKHLSLTIPSMTEIVSKGISGKKLVKSESEKYRAVKKRVKDKYVTHYWTLVEKQRHLLMRYISLLGTEQDEARESAKGAWLKAIDHAARETYKTLCTQESPRQIRAYIAGWNILYPTKS